MECHWNLKKVVKGKVDYLCQDKCQSYLQNDTDIFGGCSQAYPKYRFLVSCQYLKKEWIMKLIFFRDKHQSLFLWINWCSIFLIIFCVMGKSSYANQGLTNDYSYLKKEDRNWRSSDNILFLLQVFSNVWFLSRKSVNWLITVRFFLED